MYYYYERYVSIFSLRWNVYKVDKKETRSFLLLSCIYVEKSVLLFYNKYMMCNLFMMI